MNTTAGLVFQQIGADVLGKKSNKNRAALSDEKPAGLFRRATFIVPVGLAIAAVIAASALRTPPERAAPEERTAHVRIVPATIMAVQPRITAYGTLRPARSWRAVAQVSGRVVERHPNLEIGALVPAGTTLLRIDPQDYEIAAQRANADKQAAEAERLELKAREKSITASHKIETRSYALAKKDLVRKRKLKRDGTISAAAIEQAERALLQAEQALRQIEAQYDALPAQHKALEARLSLADAQAQKAALELERTHITLPFDARIAAVNAELDEVVRAGEPLLVADSRDRFEAIARLSVSQLDQLLANAGSDGVTGFEVRVGLGDSAPCRTGKAERLAEGLDAQSRMAGIVISLSATDTCAHVPVQKNAYATIEIAGGTATDELVVPRGALTRTSTGFDIFVADSEDRLRRRAVLPKRQQGAFATIQSGLNEGERVVVAPPQPPIDGLRLRVETDPALLFRLKAEATGISAPLPVAEAPNTISANTGATP
ncbi:MAG: efflux RND transporter periplasmic adaptor subunit [Alphaproteobacteria bacterium]